MPAHTHPQCVARCNNDPLFDFLSRAGGCDALCTLNPLLYPQIDCNARCQRMGIDALPCFNACVETYGAPAAGGGLLLPIIAGVGLAGLVLLASRRQR